MVAVSQTSDRGVMISLRVDTGRITKLAPLHQETLLNGEPAAGIVAPPSGELAAIAEDLQQRLSQATGTELALRDEADYAHAPTLACNAIALGHAGNNQLLRRMHYLGCLSDGDYPAEGLRVMTIHNPLGDGRNVVAVLGRNSETVARGAQRLTELVVQREGDWLLTGRVHEVEPLPETPDPEETLASARKAHQGPPHGGPVGVAVALGHLNAGGEERWARAFIELLTPYAVGDVPLAFELMSAVDFWTDHFVTGWDRAEEFDLFTDEERLLVANFLASCTEYCHDAITYQKWRITPDEHQIFNHHTFPARSLFFGCMYLKRHGYDVVDTDAWLEKSMAVFARAAQGGRSFDEGGGGYSWLVGNHLLSVSLARGDTSWASSDKLTHYADLATSVLNSHLQLASYGDTGTYYGSMGRAAKLLLRAAEWHDDAGAKWLAEKGAPDAAAADILAQHVASEPPARHVGLFVLPLDPVVYRWTALPRFPGYPPPMVKINVPAEECFDKLSLRGGWAEDDDYLLIQGFGDGQHGHPDANSITQYQVRGRLFLAEGDYIRRWPKEHNTVMVIRDGQHDTIPTFARLDETVQFAGGAMSSSSLVDYNGCDWRRTLLWLKDDCVVVVDSLVAQEEGDYELRCYWRTLGDASLTDCGLHADHDGEHFQIIELTDSERRLKVEDIPLNATAYPNYDYGDPAPKSLSETRRLHLQAGEQAVFVNLLLPTGATPDARRQIAWQGEDTVLVSGDGPAITISAEGFAIEDGASHTFGEALTALASRDAAVASEQATLPAERGPVAWSAALPAPATCLASDGADGALIGCEDGRLMHLDASGDCREIMRAEERIGAVLAGRIFGEEAVTWMATAHDASLHFLTPAGDTRATVSLPRTSHMPAWGTALCLADLDGDGIKWPVVGTSAWLVHPITPDWDLRWTFETTAHSVTALAAGDLSGDGRDEIAVSTVYFCVPVVTPDGERLWQDEDYNDYWTAGPNFTQLAVGDVDGDGLLEVVTAASDTLVHCISNTGEKKWTRSIGDDPAGLVITSRGIAAASLTGDVHMINGAGEGVWRRSLGCPCTALAMVGERLCVGLENGQAVWMDLDGNCHGATDLPGLATHVIDLGDAGTLIATADGSVVLVND